MLTITRAKNFTTWLATAAIGAAATLIAGQSAMAQDLTPRGVEQDKPVAIINAVVHPVSDKVLQRGFVLLDKGVISGIGEVGAQKPAPWEAAGWRVIDAQGKHVYPGLISPVTQLGLEEIAAVRASRDTNEVGAATPEVRASVAINPDSTFLPVARSNGVLLAGVFPNGNAVPGRAGVVRLDGWTTSAMTASADSGMVVNWPMSRPIEAWWMNKSKAEQLKDIQRDRRLIEDLFDGARAYHAAKAADAKVPVDLRYEAFKSVLDGQGRVYVWAQEYDQIRQAAAFAEKRGLKLAIVGGRDAPLCASVLKTINAWVIVNGTIKFPKRDDHPYDDAFTLPARLDAAGLNWCLGSGEETPHERNLPYSAALACAYGLDHDKAIKSITLDSAKALGIDKQYGSLDVGKSATVIIADGDILDVSSIVTGAFLDGREVNLQDKQKALKERYLKKYESGK